MEFRDLYGEFQKIDTIVVGISPDGAASHRNFSAELDLPFVLLSDPQKEVLRRYSAFGEKKMYGKVVMGVIRSTVWIGPDGKVRRHWPNVTRAETHPGEVLAAVQAAMASEG